MPSWINIIAGAWLMLAPMFVTGQATQTPIFGNFILGLVVAAVALFRVITRDKTPWLSWINLAIGIWLVATPFLYATGSQFAFWNNIITGAVIAFTALGSATASRAHA